VWRVFDANADMLLVPVLINDTSISAAEPRQPTAVSHLVDPGAVEFRRLSLPSRISMKSKSSTDQLSRRRIFSRRLRRF